MKTNRTFLAAALAAALATGACDDPFDQGARLPTIDAGLEAWALTGTPPRFPSGLFVPGYTMVSVDAAGSFDVAFDIDPDGRLLVFPMAKVVSPVLGQHTVGLQKTSQNYSTIIEAPRIGWVYDSIMTVNPGASFLVRTTTQYCSPYELRGQEIYAKVYVDSIDAVQRRIKLFMRVNPNCGYRSFLDGIPTY